MATGYQGEDDDDNDDYDLGDEAAVEVQQSRHKSRRVWTMIMVTAHIGNSHAPRNIWTMFTTDL